MAEGPGAFGTTNSPARDAVAWWHRASWPQRFFGACLLISPALLLSWQEGRNVSLFLAGLPGLYLGFRRGRFRDLNGDTRTILLLIALLVSSGVVSLVHSEFLAESLARIDRDLRLLFFVPWLVSLYWLRLPFSLLETSLGFGGMTIGMAAVAEQLTMTAGWLHRVNGDSHPQAFGAIAALFAVLLAGIAWQRRNQRRFALFLAAGAAASAVGAALSGSRGAALGVLAALLTFSVLTWWWGDGRGAKIFVGMPFLLLAVGSVLGPDFVLVARALDGAEELRGYLQTEAVMPPRDETQVGCQDDARLLAALPRTEYFEAENIVSAKIAKGWAGKAPCGERTRLRLQASPYAVGSAAVPRAFRQRIAVVYATGRGAELSLPGGERVTVPEHRVKRLALTSEDPATTVQIHLDPAGWIEFVPLALQPGEYRFPHASGPIGLRLEMWRAALDAFEDRPLIGNGVGTQAQVAAAMANAGSVAPIVKAYSHAHSEYLEALATRGIFGGFATVALLGGLILLSLRTGCSATGAGRQQLFAATWVALAVMLLTDGLFSTVVVAVTVGLLLALTVYLSDSRLDEHIPQDS